MEICSLDTAHLSAAVALFNVNFHRLRQAVPSLPADMEESGQVIARLGSMATAGRALAAVQDGEVLGYISWYIVKGFRNTQRLAAYCPEWGHAAAPESALAIYRALYTAAAEIWSSAGCDTHALTLLAGDPRLENFWFWNGFGMAVVDALRPMDGLGVGPAPELRLRKAGVQDAETLAILEAEHRAHYSRPPVLMASRPVDDAAAIAEFVAEPGNSFWLAEWEGEAAGFIRFAAGEFDAADCVQAADTVGITGAYTRPHARGRGIAPALIDAALGDYAPQGYARCAVDFESFNPPAVAFWPRYFTPVCYSLVRVPEAS